MTPKLLWVKNKYHKSSLSKNLSKGLVITFKEDKIVLCKNTDTPKGIYLGSGIIQTYGKCKAVIA